MSSNGDDEDRISVLPDEIIHHIHTFMPTTASTIQTGILSKRWRHLWKFNPVIHFPSLPFFHDESVEYGFVNRCLRLHIAPKIRKFIVISEVGPNSHPDIENWIDYAISKQVQFLIFYILAHPMGRRFFKLPNSFYNRETTESIEQMVLSQVDFSPPPPPPAGTALGFRGFASLKKLSLFESKLTDEALEAIMSTCLVIESLALHRCHGLITVKVSGFALKEFIFHRGGMYGEKALEIDAPNLLTLKTSFFSPIIQLKKNSCHNLLEVALFDSNIRDSQRVDNVRTLWRQLAQVELLAANFWLLTFVVQEHYMNGTRCTTFKNLKEFYFCGVLWLEFDMLSLIAFLGDCPLLKKFQVDFRITCWNEIHKKLRAQDLKPAREHMPSFTKLQGGEPEVHVGLLQQLKSIEFLYFSGYEHEMELAKCFLQNAPNLESLSLNFEDPEQYVPEEMRGGGQVSPHERELLREQLSLSPRASTHAHILLG